MQSDTARLVSLQTAGSELQWNENKIKSTSLVFELERDAPEGTTDWSYIVDVGKNFKTIKLIRL